MNNVSEKLAYAAGFFYQATIHTGKLPIRRRLRESFYDIAKTCCEEMQSLKRDIRVERSYGKVDLKSSLSSSLLLLDLVDVRTGLPLFDNNKLAYIRGVIDFSQGDAGLYRSHRPHVRVCGPETLCRLVEVLVGVDANESDPLPYGDSYISCEWFDTDALDMLGKAYLGSSISADRMNKAYLGYRQEVYGITNEKELNFSFKKTRDDAVSPFKARVSDSGYDLTLLEKVKTLGNVEMYSTGIKVFPDYGWYFLLAARSSIIKSGYMLANGVGIIDRSYTGEIMVPLIKIDPSAPDLEMPQRLVQLVPQPIVDFDMKETTTDITTTRGDKGFGSSGKV